MITNKDWSELSNLIKQLHASQLCDWSKCLLNYDMSALCSAAEVQHEIKRVSSSYIQFLNEQRNLNARGEDWGAVLQARIDALSPHLDKDVGVINISTKEGIITARYTPGKIQLIHYEQHSANIG